MEMGFIFGPVPSRRLGLSLGINIIPFKTCTYNCIYCEVGKTTNLTITRQPFFNTDNIKKEFKNSIEKVGKIDFVTFSGSGEPTLNSDIGELIDFVKSFKKYKVAVLTNGSLLYLKSVRNALIHADVVVPSLDSAREESFKKINMPHKDLKLDKIIEGLKKFSDEFKGEIWLEVLFAKNINDSEKDLDALSDVINYIKPVQVQIGTVDRPPAYISAKRLSNQEMMDVYSILSAKSDVKIEIISAFSRESDSFYDNIERSIIKMINIRPCSEKELMEVFNVSVDKLNDTLNKLFKEGKAFKHSFGGKEFIVGNRSLLG